MDINLDNDVKHPLQSKTILLGAAGALLNFVPQVRDALPPSWLPWVDGGLFVAGMALRFVSTGRVSFKAEL